MALTAPPLPSNHTLHQSRKPAYRGTRPPGLQGPPRAGTPGPGWSHRRGGGRRAPRAAVHIPGSSCSRPAPGAPPVGIGVAARGRYTVLGTAGHTPAETETPPQPWSSKVGSETLTTAYLSARLGSVGVHTLAPESHRPALEPWHPVNRPALEPWHSHGTHCIMSMDSRVPVPTLPLIS